MLNVMFTWILTGMLWSLLPLWEEATCARYWMTFLVFSVLPAPDSPLKDKKKKKKTADTKTGTPRKQPDTWTHEQLSHQRTINDHMSKSLQVCTFPGAQHWAHGKLVWLNVIQLSSLSLHRLNVINTYWCIYYSPVSWHFIFHMLEQVCSCGSWLAAISYSHYGIVKQEGKHFHGLKSCKILVTAAEI